MFHAVNLSFLIHVYPALPNLTNFCACAVLFECFQSIIALEQDYQSFESMQSNSKGQSFRFKQKISKSVQFYVFRLYLFLYLILWQIINEYFEIISRKFFILFLIYSLPGQSLKISNLASSGDWESGDKLNGNQLRYGFTITIGHQRGETG